MGCEQVGIEKHLTEHTKNAERLSQKSLEIPDGNLVFDPNCQICDTYLKSSHI